MTPAPDSVSEADRMESPIVDLINNWPRFHVTSVIEGYVYESVGPTLVGFGDDDEPIYRENDPKPVLVRWTDESFVLARDDRHAARTIANMTELHGNVVVSCVTTRTDRQGGIDSRVSG